MRMLVQLRGAEGAAQFLHNPAWSIWVGTLVTHAILLIKDVIADKTTHNVWPFEFVFWGVVLAVPVFLGILLAALIARMRKPAALE